MARPTPRAKTPYGEAATIQWSRTPIAASTALKKMTSASRNSSRIRLAPRANAIVNTSSGTIAPSAAARMALAGTSASTVCASPGGAEGEATPVPPRSAADAAGSIGSLAKTAGMTAAVSAAVVVSSAR